MKRFAVWGFLAVAWLALWCPVTLWKSSVGREERWGLLGYRHLWVGLDGGVAVSAHRDEVRVPALGATVALSAALAALGVAAHRSLGASNEVRSRRPEFEPEPVG